MDDDGRVRLSDDAPMGGLRPRADLTIADAAKLYGSALVLVVLTGMGKDGLEGAQRRQGRRRPRPGRGRVDLRRLRHAARGGRGRPRRRDPAAARAARRDCPGGRRMSLVATLRRIARAGADATTRSPPTRSRPGEPSSPNLKTDDFAALCELVRTLCGVDLAPVQAQPDGAPRAHLDRAPRHAGPGRVRQAPAHGPGRARRVPGPRDDQRLAPVAPRGPVRGPAHQAAARARRAPAAEDLERRLLLRRRGVHDRRDLPRGDPDRAGRDRRHRPRQAHGRPRPRGHLHRRGCPHVAEGHAAAPFRAAARRRLGSPSPN